MPLLSGSVNGRVEDLKGKKVVGATITASTGETATVGDYGWYHLKGITTLATAMLSATHPDFSQNETKKVVLKIDNINDPCAEDSLTFNNVNFVLKDQDVLFTVTVKDTAGNFVTARVIASNQDWRFDEEISDQTSLPGMQPGKYLFTISAPGYKTISQDINAVPNNQDLQFTMEKMGGRSSDGGLTIQEPELLWEKDLGKEILSNIVASKDGKLVVYYTTNNKPDTGKLYFLDSLTGNQRKLIPTVATDGNSQAALDTSYDGNTTALYVHAGIFGLSKGTNKLQLFNNQGGSIGSLELDPQSSAQLCEVSPDGFYVYPFQLLNKGLYQYTRYDIEGTENSEAPMTYSAQQGFHFTVGNNIVSGCPKGGGYCVFTINNNVISNLGDINGTPRAADSSQDASKIGIVMVEKAFLFSGGGKAWEKDLITRGDELDISISPGGKYVIYSTVTETEPHRVIRIFTDNNIDKTPAGSQKGTIEDTVFVTANDKGIFYGALNHKKFKYYQVGSYSTEYKPDETAKEEGTETSSNLSRYSGDAFVPAGDLSFAQLTPGLIYRADSNLRLKYLNPAGTLSITEGTIFSKEYSHRPVLLKGQLTAEFTSSMTVYAIKFDRYDLPLFQSKLSQLIAGTLAESEYFIVQNIHTKFVVENKTNAISVAVENGEVKVTSDKVSETITTGKKLPLMKKIKLKNQIILEEEYILLLVE